MRHSSDPTALHHFATTFFFSNILLSIIIILVILFVIAIVVLTLTFIFLVFEGRWGQHFVPLVLLRQRLNVLKDLVLIVVKLMLRFFIAQAFKDARNFLDGDHLVVILGVWNALVELAALESEFFLVTVFLLLDQLFNVV